MLKTIKRKLLPLVLAALPTAYSCSDPAEEIASPSPPEEPSLFACHFPDESYASFQNQEPLSADVPLAEDLVLQAGSRIVGLRPPFLYVYGPGNNASCLSDNGRGAETYLPITSECACWPTLLSCEEQTGQEDGFWRLLDEEAFPRGEECNGLDDNCNARIDDGFSPNRPIACPEETSIIYDDEFKPSACQRGEQYCRNGALTACEHYIAPLEEEICDFIDNDCDGLVDEEEYPGYWGTCGFSDETIGICQPGHSVCEDGDLQCEDAVLPQEEVCNNLDDNCNGEVDENVSDEWCYTGPEGTVYVGECRPGTAVCVAGTWQCFDQHPEAEECDGLDNDCDGMIDEGLENCLACVPGEISECRNPEIIDPTGEMTVSSCGYGSRQCHDDGTWGPCRGGPDFENSTGVFHRNEECNGYDDDCSGGIDTTIEEGPLQRTCYDGLEGTADIGRCASGTQFCENGDWTTACEGQVLPRRFDLCDDGLDNNCDGTIDNYETLYEKVDVVLAIDRSMSMMDVIAAVRSALESYLPALQGDEHRFAVITFGSVHNHETYGVGYPALVRQLTSLENVLSYLESLDVSYGGGHVEPNMDVIYLVSKPGSELANRDGSFRLAWRDDATPYLMLFTDEGAQTNSGEFEVYPYRNVTEALDVCRSQIYPCELPGCNPSIDAATGERIITNEYWSYGDHFEMDLFVADPESLLWQQLAPGRVHDIAGVVENGLTGVEIIDAMRCAGREEE